MGSGLGGLGREKARAWKGLSDAQALVIYMCPSAAFSVGAM